MPEGALEVEIKVKTIWGKFTMTQNTHTRMENFHTWENAQRCHAKSGKGWTPSKATSVHTEDNTSETDMPTSQEFGNPPSIFTDPTHTAVMPHTDLEGKAVQDAKFLGRYLNIATEVKKHAVGDFLLIGNRNLTLTTPILL